MNTNHKLAINIMLLYHHFISLLYNEHVTFMAKKKNWNKKYMFRDFPGGPVAKNSSSQHMAPRFDPWSVN